MKVHVFCFGPIAVSRNAKSIWEDVWISWKIKPGRKNYKRIAPQLFSRTELTRDEIPLDDYEIAFNNKMLKRLETEDIVYDEDDRVAGSSIEMPTIITGKVNVTKDETERMLRRYFSKKGFDNPIYFKWYRPKIIVIPT